MLGFMPIPGVLKSFPIPEPTSELVSIPRLASISKGSFFLKRSLSPITHLDFEKYILKLIYENIVLFPLFVISLRNILGTNFMLLNNAVSSYIIMLPVFKLDNSIFMFFGL